MEKVIDLPSKGIPYSGIEPTKISIRSLKGKDEKLLADMVESNVEKKYLALLKQVMTGINPEELTLGDRAYILLWLRVNSYSSTVSVNLVCQNCEDKIVVDIDLTKINIKDVPEDFKEPKEVTLSDGSIVKVRTFRIKDEVLLEDLSKTKCFSDLYMYRWALSIVDDKSIEKRMGFLDNLDVSDFEKIKEVQKMSIHGPDLDNVKYHCPKCGQDGSMILPFRPDFLLP